MSLPAVDYRDIGDGPEEAFFTDLDGARTYSPFLHNKLIIHQR